MREKQERKKRKPELMQANGLSISRAIAQEVDGRALNPRREGFMEHIEGNRRISVVSD